MNGTLAQPAAGPWSVGAAGADSTGAVPDAAPAELLSSGRSRDQHRFRQTLKDARAGLVEAQYQLSLMLANGVGTPRDRDEALAWTQRAAERGHAAAQYMLGLHYCPEPGTAPSEQTDEALAFRWLGRAAAQGHPRAHWRLARLIRQSHAVLADAHETAAADLGLTEARLAQTDSVSVGADRSDAERRMRVLREAAEQGLPAAQMELGTRLLQQATASGDSALEVDGLRWLQAAAARRWPPALLALVRHGVVVQPLSSAPADPVDAEARHALGYLWEHGLAGLTAQPHEARRWYGLAAAQGLADAHEALGRLSEAAEPDRAIEHYRSAAQAGSDAARWRLSELLDRPGRTPSDRLEARLRRLEAVQAGYAPALLDLALATDPRYGPLDPDLQADALERAARAGLPEAQRRWGLRLQARALAKPASDVERRRCLDESALWLQRASRGGDAPALTALALAYRAGHGVARDPALGLQLLHEACHQGDPGAQWQLGLLLAAGAPDVPRDLQGAMASCERAAEAGFVPAQASLGVLCMSAGKASDAVSWWRLAASAGDGEAQVNLAQALQAGRGVVRDEAAAADWLIRAAESGLAAAQARLGLAYATGKGVPVDPTAAHLWFFLAARGGDSGASKNLALSRERLPEPAWRDAERRARAWTPTGASR
jgi:hypothetical protein